MKAKEIFKNLISMRVALLEDRNERALGLLSEVMGTLLIPGNQHLFENFPAEHKAEWDDIMGRFQKRWESIIDENKARNMVEAVVALSETLQMRDECIDCGGSGVTWVDIGGEAEADPCSCTQIVDEVLRQYEGEINAARDEYLTLRGYCPASAGEDIKALVNDLLAEDRELR